MLDQPLVFLDVETTGGNALADRITEIGLVEMAGGRPAAEWSTLVNPGRNIPAPIQALTGITDSMVAAAPDFADLARALHERLAGKLLIAHNARFDYGFLRHEFRRAGLHYASRVLCTVKLSRKLDPGEARHSLDTLIERHGLPRESRHRALADARLLRLLVERWQEHPGAEALAAAAAGLLATPVLPAGMPEGALDDVPEAPGAYVIYGAGEEALYAGAAVNLRSVVLAHFSAGRRNARNVEIAQQAARVAWTETAGELSAKIEEARLVQQLEPRLNRRKGGPEPAPWPFRGRIAVRERGDAAFLVIDGWCLLGAARSESELHELMDCSRARYDPEIGRLLARFLSSPRRGYEIIDLSRGPAAGHD